MSYQANYSGTVDLKPGTSLQQIVDLYNTHCGFETGDPQLPLDLTGEFVDEQNDGQVSLHVANEQLGYQIDAQVGSGFDFDEFLTELATTYAAAPWTSYEGEGYVEETFYGPTARSVAEHAVVEAQAALTNAQRVLQAAYTDLDQVPS